MSALLWINLVAWLLCIAEALPTVADGSRGAIFDLSLTAIAVVGVAGSISSLRAWPAWRAVTVVTAAAYVVFYALRMYVLDVEPLLAIMSPRDAVADAFSIMWSSPVGRLSHAEVGDAAAQVFRECLMPLIQVGVLARAVRPGTTTSAYPSAAAEACP
ncbi:MAG TPA: hypothetical protein VM183_02085 [Burkholderiales bacterium]|nr:hypothetical protein [Burkholderiales bacterium]